MTETEIKNLIEPVFPFGAPNERVCLYQDEAVIEDDKGTALFSGRAEVFLELLPRPGIYVYVSNNDEFSNNVENAHVLVLKSSSCRIFGFPVKISHSTSTGESVKWCPRLHPILGVGDDNTKIKYLIFHLFNFKDMFGINCSSEQIGSTHYAIAHIPLEAADWKIELRSLAQALDTFKELGSKGGYGLTHVGRLTRLDGQNFTAKEASDMILLLRFFFSFTKGAWNVPICSVGFSENGNRVLEYWSAPESSWREPLSWFDEHKPQQIVELFPLFQKRWTDERWQDAFREVIYWYLNANDGSRGIDAGIILTQTAIERLSFEYAVKERKLLETAGFENLRASDKFRLLFSSLGIPIDIPEHFYDMRQLSQKYKWIDAPHALTDIRNSLVHPEHKRRGKLEDVIVDAWELGLWYLELAILRLCEYSGTYRNRLLQNGWLGQVENVPWKK